MTLRTLRSIAATLLTGVAVPVLVAAAWSMPSPAALSKIDPALLATRSAGCTQPRLVWIVFADKGEQGPSDIANHLAEARAALTPRALARRERARLSPLVDWYDVPVHQPYLDSLVAHGYQPFAVSRWFNRVGVIECDTRIEAIAEFPFVSRILPPERMKSDRTREPAADFVPPPAPPSGAFQSQSLNYGLSRKQVEQIGGVALHDSGYSGQGVLVAVFDEGFNYFDKHEALRGLDVAGRTRDFVDGDLNVQDTVVSPGIHQHGTWTLSALGGHRPGNYIGPAFGASFALARTEDSSSETPIEMVWWGMAAEWADSLGADIISSSLGYNVFFPPVAGQILTVAELDGHTSIISRAAQIAASHGMLVVNSAGNSGNDPSWDYRILFPADVNGDSLLAVGAVDSLGARSGSSSQGPTADGRTKPDVMARGVRNWLASAGGNPQAYVQQSGTSFSCPLTAGIAACLWQAHPTWPAVWIAQALKNTASRHANPDNQYGWGIVNGLAALNYVPDTAGAPLPTRPVSLQVIGPNPLAFGGPDARLRFRVESAGRVRMRVLDAQGRVVRDLLDASAVPGAVLTTAWNGRDDAGRSVAPGLYFVRLESGGRSTAVRIASLR